MAPAAEALAKIRLLALDCDGTLTAGELVYDQEGDDQHIFNVRDGHGLVLARVSGIKLILLTGRQSKSVERRAVELQFDRVIQHSRHKAQALYDYCAEHGIRQDEVCFVGDDVNDLGAARFAGISVAVADAVPELKAVCLWTTERAGGRGAVREVCEAILKAQGKWAEIVERYSEPPQRPG